MPWSVGDVDRHKKGLSPSQKRKWVSIANGVLRSCKSQGGSGCEGKAIRIANSKFNDKEIGMMARELPQGATVLLDEGHGCTAFVEEKQFKDGETKPKISMVAYSGKIIKGHWYWGDLAIDLSGMEFPKPKFPILEEHERSKKIGFTPKPIVDDKGQLVLPDDAELVDTEASREFQKLSQQGFPYQSSISARPKNIERLEEGATAEVNGFKMKGPGTIWRKSTFKEASICLFGADDRTKSQAFGNPIEIEFSESVISADKPTTIIRRKEVKKSMDLKELKDQYPDLVTQLTEEVTNPLKDQFAKERETLETQLQKEKEVNQGLSEKVIVLEKKEAIRSEAELKAQADNIWKSKLADSEIPARLHDKVMAIIGHEKYVKDEVLNVEEFTKAIEDEIKDWETKLTSPAVQGSSFSDKDVDTAEGGDKDAVKLAEENKAISNRLLSHVGQKPEESKT